MLKNLPGNNSIQTVEEFVALAREATQDQIYEMFENGPCTEQVRDQIYDKADSTSPEPFRSAMINLGFPKF
jgi:hypothetical protein